MENEQEVDVALFEQLKIFDPKKFLLRLEDLTKQGNFLLEVIYGSANLTNEFEKENMALNSRANYILTNHYEEEKIRVGTIYFETGTMKNKENNDYFENMALVTEEHLHSEKTIFPKISLKIRLIMPWESDKVTCRRYDRKRVLFDKFGWTRTPEIKPFLPTSCFIKDPYLIDLEETFNGDYRKD